MKARAAERRRSPGRSDQKADAPGLAARRGALELLSAVLDGGDHLEETQLDALAPSERAAARGLADLTLRRLGQIDAALGAFVEHMPPAPACHILRLMTAEMLFADTPPHAGVDSAVRLARATRGAGRLSGLVNAVGRKVAGLETPGDDGSRANLPGWLDNRLVRAWGRDATDAMIRAHLLPAPHDLSLRTPGDGEALVHELGGALLPSGTLRLDGRPQLSALPGYAQGAWWVQDAAAALPALMLAPRSGMRVLDLCAAPGGKTMQLAAAGAQVTALDRSQRRMARLRENLARTGLTASCVLTDALAWEPEAPFDAILLDAPCSATGTIRRHPDLPHRFRKSELDALTALQVQLLDRAWGWLARGGSLVYATCSILPEEGEAQAAAFLKRTPDARIAPLEAEGAWLPPDARTADGALRTFPSMLPDLGGVDGFFAVRFSKPG